MAFNITTTGSVAFVVFDDLGARTLTHPITIDLQQEYTIEELFESDSIQNALLSGSISVVHNGVSVSDLNDYRVRVSQNVINNISNTTGNNTGDETTASIQSKRPIKTIGGQSLEGAGNIPIPPNGVQSVTGDGVDNADPENPVLSFPDASQVLNAFDKSTDDASDINMASSTQTVQNKIVNIQNEVDALDAISLNPTGGAGQSYDWNTVITAGVYRGNGTTTNGPAGFNGFESVLVYTPVGTDYIVHQALDGTGTEFAFRRSNDGGATWSVWVVVPSSSPTTQKEHRHIYFGATNTTDTVINNVNVPVKVAGTTTQGFGTNGLVMSGVNRIVNQSNRSLRVKVEAVLSLDKEEGGGNDNYTFFINQTGANLIGSKSTSEGRNNDWNTANPTWIGDMANGQWFEVWVQNIDSANDLKVSDYSLIVQEI
jgi:hypothetical protein